MYHKYFILLFVIIEYKNECFNNKILMSCNICLHICLCHERNLHAIIIKLIHGLIISYIFIMILNFHIVFFYFLFGRFKN